MVPEVKAVEVKGGFCLYILTCMHIKGWMYSSKSMMHKRMGIINIPIQKLPLPLILIQLNLSDFIFLILISSQSTTKTLGKQHARLDLAKRPPPLNPFALATPQTPPRRVPQQRARHLRRSNWRRFSNEEGGVVAMAQDVLNLRR